MAADKTGRASHEKGHGKLLVSRMTFSLECRAHSKVKTAKRQERRHADCGAGTAYRRQPAYLALLREGRVAERRGARGQQLSRLPRTDGAARHHDAAAQGAGFFTERNP